MGVSFGGFIGVIDWYLWIFIMVGLCELGCDGLEGLLLGVIDFVYGLWVMWFYRRVGLVY